MGLVLTALVCLGVGALPQFAGPGYEMALVAGLVLPSIIAVTSALDLAGQKPEPFDAFCRGVGHGALATLVLLVSSLIHGVRVGFCDPIAGLEILVLGPGLGLCLAGAYGALAAELSGRIERARLRKPLLILAALLGPLGSIGVGAYRFLSSPMIFGYDPFVGFFSGTIYDTVIDLSGLLSYRAGTAATLFAGFVIALHLAHDLNGKLVYQSIGRPGLLLLGAGLAAVSVIHSLSGPELGHWQTSTSIARVLGGVIDGTRCRVVYSRAIPSEDAQRFARECEALVVEAEDYLQVTGPPQVTAYLFDDAAQKQRLMGASGTNIAKPWRAEVYVQGTSYPHRVLGHELVHVVAGASGRGPFRVAGAFGGWLPNPGLIEGVAVAAQPRDDDLSAMEWAKAMKDLGLLPPLENLFGLGFLGENSSLAYTVSGAFVGFVHDRFGAKVISSWYGGGDIEALTGKSWSALEAEFVAELDTISLNDAANVRAKAKFDRPGFFERRCPRAVDGCRQRAHELARSGDALGALLQIERARELDPNEPGLRIEQAQQQQAAGQEEVSTAALVAIRDDTQLPTHVRDDALALLADRQLVAGELEPARKSYEALISRTLEAGELRALGVKVLATRDDGMRPAVIALLIGSPTGGADRTKAAELLGKLDGERPTDGIAAYLLARMRFDARDYVSAGEHLDRALSRKLAVPQVRPEALRLRAQIACTTGDGAAARRALADYAREPEVPKSRYDVMRRFVARCGGTVLAELPAWGKAP